MLLELTVPIALTAIADKRRFQQVGARSRIVCAGRNNLYVLLDFPGDCCGVFADSFANALKRNSMEQAILNLNAVFKRWVLSGAIFLYG